MSTEVAAAIKACQGIYSMGDTAKHFSISKSTVFNIWHGNTHTGVAPTEAPWIKPSRVSKDVIKEDYPVLRQRGWSIDQIASHLGVGRTTVYKTIKEVAA